MRGATSPAKSPAGRLRIRLDADPSGEPTAPTPVTCEALYSAGKKWFELEDFAKALIDFELCLDTLEREVARVPDGSLALKFVSRANTGYRNLDDYLMKCSTMVKREEMQEELAHKRARKRAQQEEAALSGSVISRRAAPANTTVASDLVIWACNPSLAPLPQIDDEAAAVSQHFPAAIHRGGDAEALRRKLLETPTRMFLFIGHADASIEGGARTLAFTTASGGNLIVAPNSELASMFGLSSTTSGGSLEFVFLNGCCSEELGREIQRAGVLNVVCWRTRTEDRAACLFSVSFFHALKLGHSYRRAFEEGKRSVMYATQPGQLDGDLPSRVPKYELRDPASAGEQWAAGVPLLLDREGEHL
jgi:hypothetical protein